MHNISAFHKLYGLISTITVLNQNKIYTAQHFYHSAYVWVQIYMYILDISSM